MTASSASIAATNSFVAGQQVYFTTTGVLPAGFTANSNYFVISTGLSGSAFEVAPTLGGTAITVGTGGSGTQTVHYTASVALNGTLVNTTTGIAVLTTPQRVLITTADTTTKFTIIGASATGALLTETLTNAGSSVQSTLDYATVSAINVNQGTTAAITVGTNGVGSTPWARLDEWASPNVSVQVNVTGTVNYTVQSSNDDPNDPSTPVAPSAMTWINTNDTNAVNATGSIQTNFLFAPKFARVYLNSGSGSLTATFVQYEVVHR
jgi:hypothetical protein